MQLKDPNGNALPAQPPPLGMQGKGSADAVLTWAVQSLSADGLSWGDAAFELPRIFAGPRFSTRVRQYQRKPAAFTAPYLASVNRVRSHCRESSSRLPTLFSRSIAVENALRL